MNVININCVSGGKPRKIPKIWMEVLFKVKGCVTLQENNAGLKPMPS